MPPVGYPTRGEWVFTNLTRDFRFWPTLTSISISQSHPDALTVLTCRVAENLETGLNMGLVFANEDEYEVTFAGTRIAAGLISVPGEDQSSQVGPKVWDLSGEDYTSKLDDAIVRRRRKRQREKIRKRVRWLLSFLRPSIWTLDGRDIDVPDTDAEPYEYFGMSVREALQQVADEHRLFFYVDLDNRFQMFRTNTSPAPFDLDNTAPDYADTFPFDSWVNRPDSVELANAVLVQPEHRNDARWSRDPVSILAYDRHERFISDPNLDKPQQARNVGERTLAQSAEPKAEATCRVLEPGLRAGMRLNVREVLWDHDYERIIKGIEITAVDPHDDESKAQMRQVLTLVDRRPPGRGRGGSDSHNRHSRHRHHSQPANPGPHVLDNFGTDVAAPTIITGAAWAGLTGYYVATSRGVAHDGSDDGPYIDGPNPVLKMFQSSLGHEPSYEGANTFRGWWEKETYAQFTVPTHPASMAGVRAVFSTFGSPSGYAWSGEPDARAEVIVRSSPPTDIRQGTVIGEIPIDGGSHSVDVPGGLIPAGGGNFYVGLRPKWQANYGAFVTGYFQWPFASVYAMTDSAGVHWAGRSGRAQMQAGGATWLTYSSPGGTLPDAAAPASAPYAGGWPWEEAGRVGSPLYDVEGGALRLTATAPAAIGWMMRGEREDDDSSDGPWSDVAWGAEVLFDVSASGLTDQDGTRSIEVTTTGQDQRTVGTVHLGDEGFAEGISVGGPSPLDYEAVPIGVNERWVALFDSRSGYEVRGRLWRQADRMPTNIDVRTPLLETEDDLDRWSLWLRAGNVTGAQTVRVHRVRYLAAAYPGQRVVNELVGKLDGLTRVFYTANPFREGSLRLRINGTPVPPDREDGALGYCRLDWYPTPGGVLRANYTAD